MDDTEKGGAGLCDHDAVDLVVREGPHRVLELLEEHDEQAWGRRFGAALGFLLGGLD